MASTPITLFAQGNWWQELEPIMGHNQHHLHPWPIQKVDGNHFSSIHSEYGSLFIHTKETRAAYTGMRYNWGVDVQSGKRHMGTLMLVMKKATWLAGTIYPQQCLHQPQQGLLSWNTCQEKISHVQKNSRVQKTSIQISNKLDLEIWIASGDNQK
jgi:hypothetical protein